MARNTGARLGGAVIEARPQEGDGVGMANFAWLVGGDMARGHRRGRDTFASGVTTGTVPRRSLKHSTYVAGTAFSNGMCSGQYETGGHVVEISRRGFRAASITLGC